MPQFMGYEKRLKENLKKKYEVTWINCDQYDRQILTKYKNCTQLRWMIRNISSKLKESDQEKVEKIFLQQELKRISQEKDYYSVVFCINGSFLADEFYRVVKKRNPNARFIFYAWDDIKNLLKQSHIKMFDELYAYNIGECKKYNWGLFI